ncbi:MAG: histidinol dehydrogenase [Actinomycetota bacterium]|nr:histidinol dehydrogenase [Actinomycetota bacterium]
MLELLDLRNRRERLEPRHLEVDPGISATVGGLIERVRTGRDAALLELTLKFDGADLRESGLVATPEEFLAAREATPEPLRDALDALIRRLEGFHGRQLPPAWEEENAGVRFGEIVRPLRTAGCYVPGGRASYPSSVAMTVVPARVAGVEEVVVCTPPAPDGSLNPAVLHAAERAGAEKVVKIGGAQAIAAMAFGTDSVPAVDRIVGPGNAYVTEAKRQLAGRVGIDGLAGPTELVVVADSRADIRTLTVDLIAQAEHDPAAIAILVTTDPVQVDAVRDSLEEEAVRTDRREIVEGALGSSQAIVVGDMAQAVEVVNDLAPEHLQLLLQDARPFAEGVRNAGAIFVGPFTAVPFGDYGVASNHVLPTAGTARFASGLRASDFVTVSSVVEVSDEAAARLAPEVATIARSEGLFAHARAVELRTERAPTSEAER